MRKHLFWIVELFIWLLILFMVSGTIMLAKYNYKKNFNTYQIFLPDVDGLIDGSPVRLLGIQVGYVNQVAIVGDDVYVKFIVTQKGVKIPRGSSATVEFYGLGGSKSLEIYPPTENASYLDKMLIAQNPKRIHDSLGLLNDMIDKLMRITYDVSHFMDEVGIIKNQAKTKAVQPKTEQKSIIEFLEFSNAWMDKAQKRLEKFNKKIKEVKNERRKNQDN